MGYTRKYTEKIEVKYTGSVTYPASQSGGTKSYSGTVYEEVNVVVEVDTAPFNESVEQCNTNVNLLTGAVVATEAAQIASKTRSSQKIADTIVKGFFGLIRSEISQQIAELKEAMDSQSMHLRELSRSLIDKKRQMEADFTRISSRYVKIFDDLNNELSNRVHELDKPTFHFRKELDSHHKRTTRNDMVNTVAVFGKEGGQLQSKIGASVTKKRAHDTMGGIRKFLSQQRRLDSTIQRNMLRDDHEGRLYAPVCFIETRGEGGGFSKEVLGQEFVKSLKDGKIKDLLLARYADPSLRWAMPDSDKAENIRMHFTAEIRRAYPMNDLHATRVRELIGRLYGQDRIKTLV